MLHIAYFTNYAIQSLADRWKRNEINIPKHLPLFQQSAPDTSQTGLTRQDLDIVSNKVLFNNAGSKYYNADSAETGVTTNSRLNDDKSDLAECETNGDSLDPYAQYADLLEKLNINVGKSANINDATMPSITESEDEILNETELNLQPLKCSSVTDLFEGILEKGISKSSSLVTKAISDGHVTVKDLLTHKDVDHFTLLEKAVVYDDVALAEAILSGADNLEAECMTGTIHLAAFLGSAVMMKTLLKVCPGAAQLKGRVQLGAVSGPPSALLDPYLTSQGSVDKVQQTLHWVNTHCSELPICFSTCADNRGVNGILLNHCDNNLLLELLTIACVCDSAQCLPSICRKLPLGVNSRDSQGALIAIKGLGHGVVFIERLLKLGLQWDRLNHVDEYGSNALHYLFKGISKQDKIYSKYSSLYETTLFLVEKGINVNQESVAFKSHGLKDTPLHLLLENCNHVIGINSRDYIRVTTRRRLQTILDRSLLQSIAVILAANYNKQLHIKTLMHRLFETNNVWLRLANCHRFEDLKNRDCGLQNISLILCKLLRKKMVLTYGRRDTTPITLLLTGLYQNGGALEILERYTGDSFVSILRVLLSNGVSPNIYHLRTEGNWQQGPGLFYFLQGVIYQHKRGAYISDDILANIVKVCELFCSYDSTFTTSILKNGRYVKCSIYDCLLNFLDPFIDTEYGNVDHLANILHCLSQLLKVFLSWGAETVVYSPHWSQTISTHHLKSSLVQSWIHLLPRFDHSLAITSLPQFHDVLRLMLNTASHYDYHAALSKKNFQAQLRSGDSLAEDLIFLSLNPRPLISLCRVTLYKCLQHRYKSNIRHLPLPRVLCQYLLSLE